ncbi:MAG TPA: hypothetical protein VIH08_01775 [Blastococcus sp.]
MRAGLRGGRMFHGGAGLAPSAARGAVFPDDEETEAGRRVGAFAARLMEPVERIVIDAGPIAYAFAQAIPEDFAGCVITHSMPVPQLFDQRATAARTVALGVAPGPRQRRVQDRDGACPAACSAGASASAATAARSWGGQVGGRAGQQRLDPAEYAGGQVTGDRGGLGRGQSRIKDEVGRSARGRGRQLRLGHDGRGRLAHDNSSAIRKERPHRADASAPSTAGDHGLDRHVDGRPPPIDMEPGQAAGANRVRVSTSGSGRRWTAPRRRRQRDTRTRPRSIRHRQPV